MAFSARAQEQPRQFHRIAAVGLDPTIRDLRMYYELGSGT